MATRWVDRINLYASARLKLTLFYLSIIFLFNLIVTIGVRVLAEHEYMRSNSVQRSEVKEWGVRFFRIPSHNGPDVVIADIQEDQAAVVRAHLNEGLFFINLAALGIGGLLSYWFAGRTLKPIQEAHEAQARFTADASHELRTPLTNMQLENEVFLHQKEFTEAEAREQIASNLEEVQRLSRLSTNLLALHQYGQAALERTPVEITEVVAASVNQVKKIAQEKQVKITNDIAAGRVLIHRESVIQLVDILLDNALKYAAQGKTVVIKGEQQSNAYVITVSDKGPGIAEQDLPHIFDRLYRGDKARSSTTGGYGLGLALAQEIARANNATVTARNNTDDGACFSISFELAKAPK